jgi:hypothetical protein
MASALWCAVRCGSGPYPPSLALRIGLAVLILAPPMQLFERCGNSSFVCRSDLRRLEMQGIAGDLADRHPFGSGLALGGVTCPYRKLKTADRDCESADTRSQ